MDRPPVVVAESTSEAEATPPAPSAAFCRLDSDEPARVVLHQVNHREFQLVEGFRYRGRRGAWDVRPEDLPDTDLASIPRLLGWFASSYGRHTLAALLHDHLVRNGDGLSPPVARHLADDVFREALDELGVPYLRSRIMWSAVVLATRWRATRAARLAIAAWMFFAGVGITALVAGLATSSPLVLLPTLLAPVPFAALWGRRDYVAGLVGGYTLWFVVLPTLLGVLAYTVYMAAEVLAMGLRTLTRPKDVPQPAGPPSFGER